MPQSSANNDSARSKARQPAHERVDDIVLTDRERQVFRAIQADPAAKKSFDFLARKTAATSAELLTYFVIEAWAPLIPEVFETKEEIDELRSLVKSIKTLSSKIKKTNERPELSAGVPRVDICSISDREELTRSFRNLPDLLLTYARNLTLKAETLDGFRRSRSRLQGKASGLEYSDSLISWIKARTGHAYTEHVATIQQITYREASRARVPASGETLRKREQRKRKSGIPRRS